MTHTVLLVGCGKMGGALLDGWLKAGTVARVHVVEPGGASLPADPAVHRVAGADDLPADLSPDAVVLAVKPQAMDQVAPAYARFADRSVFLSIAAGKTIAYFADRLGEGAAIVRAMPNTPAAIGKGVTVLAASMGVTPQQRALCDRLMRAAGTVDWVEDEGLLDAVTALSGGGPAYVFLLIESLAKAGAASGLPADLAMRLARRTVIGAGALAEASDDPAETLRRNVTSPNGTTQAALEVLMAEDAIQPLFDRAIAAAARRSRELAS
ncbi:MAG TPA: pyrroline-5-carboxylate reductase [Alphaproteobacteria bacterium]|nr:pyrroline-5-carboxylate reductase [Alphaproteobacteria bacterium]